MNKTITTNIPNISSISNNFNIMHQNIRSINKNFDELQILIKSLNLSWDIIILTECWLTDKYYPLQIDKYVPYSTIMNNTKNDGVIVYIKEDIEADVKEISINNANCLRISIGNDTTILAIYRSPSTQNLEPFLNSLSFQLSLLKNTKDVFIIGDINIDILQNGHPKKYDYMQTLAYHGYKSLIDEPTRVYNESKTCIDHIFSKTNKKTQAIICTTTLTDHYTIILSITKKNTYVNQKKISLLTKTETNWKNVKLKLTMQDWTSLLEKDDTDSAWSYFIEIIQNITLSNTKTIEKKVSHKNVHIKPWISQNIINSIRKRDELHRKVKNNPNDVHILRFYKRYRNTCKNVIRYAKETFYKNKIEECNNDSRKLWQIINEITNAKASHNDNSIKELNIDETPTSFTEHPDKLLDYINNYFCNIGSNLANKIKQNSITVEKPQSIEHVNQENSLNIVKITGDEIRNIIASLNVNNSSGNELISSKSIKYLQNELIHPLTFLINLSISKGIFPACLKIATIIPIYKNGPKNDISNYRPISLLTTLSKILEKVIKKQVLTFLDSNKILSSTQYGFRENLGTSDAIANVTNTIIGKLDEGKKCLAVFIDLQKAFDTIDHEMLYLKLKKNGITEATLNLLRSYLTGREQFVQIGKRRSKTLPIKYGVPQGSVLGPLLFLIYINDLMNLPIKGNIMSFADDTVIIFHEQDWTSTYKEAERGLAVLQNWLKANSLTLNVNKTKYLTFSKNKRGQPMNEHTLQLHECQNNFPQCSCPHITQTKSIKYLGIEIDEKLQWDSHIDRTSKKLTKLIYFFKKLRNILSTRDLKRVYYALCHSKLEYGIIGWGSAASKHIKQLKVTQNCIIKTILRVPIRMSTTEIFKQFDVPSIQKIYAKNILVHHLKNDSQANTSHTHKTRAKQTEILNIPKCNSTFGQRSSEFLAVKVYNKLPLSIKQIKTKNNYIKDIKSWLKELPEKELTDIFKTSS